MDLFTLFGGPEDIGFFHDFEVPRNHREIHITAARNLFDRAGLGFGAEPAEDGKAIGVTQSLKELGRILVFEASAFLNFVHMHNYAIVFEICQ